MEFVFANDPFEAERPNTGRHVAWDGWAVRKETAPVRSWWCPGRTVLYNRSHAFFALRQWWHYRGDRANAYDDRGTPSEGTFHDLVRIGRILADEQIVARHETERRSKLYEVEALYAQELYRNAEKAVQALVYERFKLGHNDAKQAPPDTRESEVYLAADANPGDIVSPGEGEEGRPVYATAASILRPVTRFCQAKL